MALMPCTAVGGNSLNRRRCVGRSGHRNHCHLWICRALGATGCADSVTAGAAGAVGAAAVAAGGGLAGAAGLSSCLEQPTPAKTAAKQIANTFFILPLYGKQ